MSSDARPCPVCGTTANTAAEAIGKRAIGGGPLLMATCVSCGTAYQPTVPTTADLVNWYEYMGHDDRPGLESSELLDRRLGRTLERLRRFRSTGRLLDVGCGRGEMVLKARDLGWDVHATEISPSCVRQLRPVLGRQLHEGDLLSAPFADASFDVILMIEVLEHLDDPARYLRAALRLLRPGGALLLTTPNYRGLSGRMKGLGWRVVADEHLTLFDERGLRRLLADSGFSSIEMSTTGLDIPALVSRLRAVGRVGSGPGVTRAMRPTSGAGLVDRVIEIGNALVQATHLGDRIRATAERPV